MPFVNIESIMKKVANFANTDAGRKKIKETINEKMTSENGTLSSGDKIATLSDMNKLAEDLIETMKNEATLFEYRIPASVLDHFDSLSHTQPKLSADKSHYEILIYFQDDLSRASLLITSGNNKGSRTGDGIKNIVSLFDTGYSAGKQVYGVWSGHEDLGVVSSKQSRDGLYFIEKAIDSFNARYGSAYNLEARVSASDEFYSSFNY